MSVPPDGAMICTSAPKDACVHSNNGAVMTAPVGQIIRRASKDPNSAARELNTSSTAMGWSHTWLDSSALDFAQETGAGAEYCDTVHMSGSWIGPSYQRNAHP